MGPAGAATAAGLSDAGLAPESTPTGLKEYDGIEYGGLPAKLAV